MYYESPLASQHTEQTGVDMDTLFVKASSGKDCYKFWSSLPQPRCTPHGTGIYTKVKVDRLILLLIFIFSHFCLEMLAIDSRRSEMP